MSNQPNTSRTVIFRSRLLPDSIATLNETLSKEGLGVRDKDFTVSPLGAGKYVIGFDDPPDCYEKILEKYGKLIY